MKATVRHQGEVAIIDLVGRLVYADGEGELKQPVEELLGRGERRILLNLERVAFMDSSGIVELVGCHKKACEKGAEIRLVNPSPKVRELLTVTQLSDVLPIYNDEEGALGSFREG
jgi:anti-sigma B factor antagonist